MLGIYSSSNIRSIKIIIFTFLHHNRNKIKDFVTFALTQDFEILFP